MKKSMPTMKDVAQEAGVALGTVSKVFNGIAVGESYRIKVEDAARKLGYEVNQYARGLRAGTTYTVALILPNVDHPFFALLAQHVCTALMQRGYRMLLYVTAASPEAERECVGMVRQNKADGVIALTYNQLEAPADVPFVSIDRCLGPNIPCVASDNYAGGRLAAERLLALGCTRLAFLRIGSSHLSETDKRGDGFESLCRARQVPCCTMRLNDDAGEEAQFRRFFQDHLQDGRLDIDGIFCATDLLALWIRRILADLGLRVPEDVQIVGFDGIQQLGSSAYYCSTIVQPAQKIAETCVDLLLAKDRSNIPALVCLPVSYAPGGTTRE